MAPTRPALACTSSWATPEVRVSQAPLDYELGGTAAEVGLGGTVSLVDNVHLYADVDYRIPFGDGRQGAQVIGGLRVAF